MLLQSKLNEIQLLPAVPYAWGEGHIKGLVARGAFEIEMFWKSGKLTKAFITSKAGNICKLRTSENIAVRDVKINSVATVVNSQKQYIHTFNTTIGKTYELIVQ